MERASKGIDRHLSKNETYESLQLLRTHVSRFVQNKDVSSAENLVLKYAPEYSTRKEYEIILDLIHLLLKIWREAADNEATDERVLQVVELFGLLPAHECKTKYKCIHAALVWTQKEWPTGHPSLHRAAADAYMEEEDYGSAQVHLVYCGDGEGLAEILQKWSPQGYASETDLFFLRCVLMVLCVPDMETAQVLLKSSAYKFDGCVPAAAQLAFFIVQACKLKNKGFLDVLCSKYFLVTRRDVQLEKYINQLPVLYMGEKKQASGLIGMMDALFSTPHAQTK
eukprot:Platyproteum_vivax@DN15959_c0_g1_i1.p1